MSPLQRHQHDTAQPPDVNSNQILEHLTSQQHLHPHLPVKAVLDETVQKFGCCPAAIDQGIAWLHVQPDSPVGRLRRTELVQLARAVHRFWIQNIGAAAASA